MAKAANELMVRALLGGLLAVAIAVGGWAVHRADAVGERSVSMNDEQALILVEQGKVIVRTEEQVKHLNENVHKALEIQEDMRKEQGVQGSKLDRILGKLDG